MTNICDGLYDKVLKDYQYVLLINIMNQKFVTIFQHHIRRIKC